MRQSVCLVVNPNMVNNFIWYERIGYDKTVMRHSACLVVNPNMVNNFVSLFSCMPLGLASESVGAQHKAR